LQFDDDGFPVLGVFADLFPCFPRKIPLFRSVGNFRENPEIRRFFGPFSARTAKNELFPCIVR